MKKPMQILCATFGALLLLDVLVAGVLYLGETRVPALRSLVTYFEYGRSVPGKLRQWVDTPGTAGNLYSVAWMPDVISRSVRSFDEEDLGPVPTVRSYGMSFANNILRAAIAKQPDLKVDIHAGPGAPPNFTYALFLDDVDNRREGDVVVLGILSSAVPALAAMSNRTWAFEQPAPFTYPKFSPTADGSALERIDPLVRSEAQERALADDSEHKAAWTEQLRRQDAFWSPITFGGELLDRSPFMRLVRRSLAQDLIAQRKQRLQSDHEAIGLPLRLIVTEFSREAREQGLFPVVFLIQTRDPRDVDLLTLLRPDLVAEDIAYLATAEHFDPRDPSGFRGDGHYKEAVDMAFADAFLTLLQDHGMHP